MRVLYILWLRQVKKYFRSRSRIIGALGQPVLYLFALGYGLGSVFQKAGNGNYIQFLVPGIIAQSILFTSIFSGIEIIWDKQFGFLKETLVAPVPRWKILLGRTLGGATVATLQGLLVLVLSFIFKFRPTEWSLTPVAILAMLLLSTLFTLLGTAIASVVDDMQGFQLIMNFMVMPLYFLSGALYPLNNLPKFLSVVTSIDPMTYGVDLLRGTLISLNHFSLTLDLSVLAVITVIITVVGTKLFSKIQA
jgi:ABC-2 type transport system permease protein